VPVEVLRCVPRRYLAGEGYDGGRWEMKDTFFFVLLGAVAPAALAYPCSDDSREENTEIGNLYQSDSCCSFDCPKETEIIPFLSGFTKKLGVLRILAASGYEKSAPIFHYNFYTFCLNLSTHRCAANAI
jgi:hypothetical protein